MSFPENLASLLADESARAREFPVVAHKTYLAHAAVCPLPACVVRAMTDYLEKAGRAGQFEYGHAAAERGARSIAAAMIGVEPDEIAFAPSTSAGLATIAAGLRWRPGDSVVFPEGDFPSNVYPWRALERRGVRPHPIPARADGAVTLDDVVTQLDERTRLVALSSVHFATGARTDIDAIGRELRRRGVLFCVDAIQSLGVLPTPGRHVDFLVADGHKWLLGPQGMGLLFVRRERFAELDPPLLGWKSVDAQKNFVKRDLELATTARRYEPGSLNATGLIGLHAALRLLEHIGVAAIAERLATLRAYLAPELDERGYEVLGPDGPARPVNILSFRREGADLEALYRKLDQAGVVVSLRHDPLGRPCVRVAPHFYNTQVELDRLIALL